MKWVDEIRKKFTEKRERARGGAGSWGMKKRDRRENGLREKD